MLCCKHTHMYQLSHAPHSHHTLLCSPASHHTTLHSNTPTQQVDEGKLARMQEAAAAKSSRLESQQQKLAGLQDKLAAAEVCRVCVVVLVVGAPVCLGIVAVGCARSCVCWNKQ